MMCATHHRVGRAPDGRSLLIKQGIASQAGDSILRNRDEAATIEYIIKLKGNPLDYVFYTN